MVNVRRRFKFGAGGCTTSPAVFDPNLVTKGKKVPTDYFFFSLFFSLSFAFDPM